MSNVSFQQVTEEVLRFALVHSLCTVEEGSGPDERIINILCLAMNFLSLAYCNEEFDQRK